MAKLVISCLSGGRQGARFEFDQDVVTIGRRPENDVPFDAGHDRKASGRHAEVRREDGRFILHDLGSTNGTFVGAQRLSGPTELTDGSNVEFGKDGPVLHFRIVTELATEDRTVLADAPGLATQTSDSTERGAAVVQPPSTGRTGIYRAMMLETVSKSSRRLKTMIAVLAALLVVGGLAAGWYIFSQKKDIEKQKEDMEKQQGELADQRERTQELSKKADLLKDEAATAQEEQRRLATKTKSVASRLKDARRASEKAKAAANEQLAELKKELEKAEGEGRKKLEAQASELNAAKAKYQAQLDSQKAQLKRLEDSGNAGETIAAKYEHSLFMLMGRTKSGREFGFCTAFAISSTGILTTNAHCVRAINRYTRDGHKIYARMNRRASETYEVIRWKSHSEYRDSAFSADVALLKVELNGGKLAVAAVLATPEKVLKLRSGMRIFTMGFPGKVMNEAKPAADFRATTVSRITTYKNASGLPRDTKVVWHSALTSKGTSGSPIFDEDGQVIAVNNGGLSARRVVERDERTGATRERFAYDATGLNFGIRVDTVHQLLQ